MPEVSQIELTSNSTTITYDIRDDKARASSIPSGGLPNQFLKKSSTTDYDTNWTNLGSMAAVDDVTNNGKSYGRKYDNNLGYIWYDLDNRYYTEIESRAIICAPFSTTTNYTIGDYVIQSAALYRFTTAHSAGAWDSSHVTQVQTMTELKAKADSADLGTMAYVDNPTGNSSHLRRGNEWVSAASLFYSAEVMRMMECNSFSTGVDYAVGDYVIYGTNGNTDAKLWYFKTAHPKGAWNSADVDQVQIMTEIKKINTSLSTKVNSADLNNLAPFKITGSITGSGNLTSVTITDSRINSENWKIPENGIYFSNPSAVLSEVSWETDITNHTIIISGKINGQTNMIIDIFYYQNI